MKTLMQYPIKVYAILLLNLFALNLSAQQTDSPEPGSIQLDTVSIVANQESFENLVCDIVLNENFQYRKTLKHSKASKKYYVFADKRISEVEILKYFKKAARKSESIQEFISYFYEKKINFMEFINHKDISALYKTFRKGTLNAYLQRIDSAFPVLI